MYATRIFRITCAVVVAGLYSLAWGGRLCAQTELDFIARRDSKVTGWVVAVGDFNGDRHQDLVTTQESTLYIQLGNKDGHFTAGRSALVGGAPVAVAVGDFNRDGRQDLATANGDAGTVSVLLGRGDGSFRVARNFRVGGAPNSITVSDFNKDGRQDLATANGDSSTVSVLLGRGDGSFGARTFQVGGTPSLLTVGDFNGDGRQDVAVANGGTIVSVLLGKGNGTFSLAVDTDVGENVGNLSSIAAGDFNEDGRQDLAVTGEDSFTPPTLVLLATGDGTFQVTSPFWWGGGFLVRTTDFNGDGHQDLAVAWGVFQPDIGTASSGLFTVMGQGDGTFRDASGFQMGGDGFSFTLGDFDADGRQDLAIDRGLGHVSILQGRGDGSFQDERDFEVGDAGLTETLRVGDFNGDGRQDLATLGARCFEFRCHTFGQILLNNGDGTFEYGASFEHWPYSVGDLNGDGRSDLVLFSGNTVSIQLSKANGTFQDPKNFRVAGVPSSVTVGDFNGDRRQDLAIANASGFGLLGGVSIFLGKGDGTFQLSSILARSPGPMTVGDFNGDGRQDLASADSTSNRVSVFLGNGNGTFQVARNFTVGDQPGSITVGDFNSDGRQDLAVGNAQCNEDGFCGDTVSILLGKGDDTFEAAGDLAVGPGFDSGFPFPSISVADFDNDGRQDLALFNSEFRNVSIFLSRGDGTFEKPRDFGVGGQFTSGVAADFNGDGLPDLATDFVSILINNSGTKATSEILPRKSLPTATAALRSSSGAPIPSIDVPTIDTARSQRR